MHWITTAHFKTKEPCDYILYNFSFIFYSCLLKNSYRWLYLLFWTEINSVIKKTFDHKAQIVPFYTQSQSEGEKELML